MLSLVTKKNLSTLIKASFYQKGGRCPSDNWDEKCWTSRGQMGDIPKKGVSVCQGLDFVKLLVETHFHAGIEEPIMQLRQHGG